MKHLRVIFEEQLRIVLSEEGHAVIGESSFPPAVILGYDTTAYEAEFDIWLSEQWFPEQEQRLEAILTCHGNKKRFIDLCRAAENDQVIPFVGSGMSVPTGLLTWTDFLRSIRNFSKLAQEDLEHLLKASAYEEAVEKLMSTMPKRLFNERVEHDLRIDNPNSIKGCIRYLPTIFSSPVVLTTNLDDLLEQLYKANGCTFAHILAGSNLGQYRKLRSESESFLLKLHGDCRTSEGRVLSATEYHKAYAPDGAVFHELALMFGTKSLLFLGCSLMGDRTVRLIAEVAAGDQNMPKHYAFLLEPDDEQTRIEREHFLSERGIYPIWYRGDHDESIEALFVGILRHLGRL